jgi:hypothetical protein
MDDPTKKLSAEDFDHGGRANHFSLPSREPGLAGRVRPRAFIPSFLISRWGHSISFNVNKFYLLPLSHKISLLNVTSSIRHSYVTRNVVAESDAVHSVKMFHRCPVQFEIATAIQTATARADVMYGVTMEEFGVSKPVGMRLTNADGGETKKDAKTAAQKAALRLDA